MKERVNKFLIYFKSNPTSYWNLTESSNNSLDDKLGKYPLSIKQRITEGHYPPVNKKGIPLIGDLIHYTTITSYGLGLWEMYIEGQEDKMHDFLQVANFIKGAVDNEGKIIQQAYANHRTGVSAMIQGEAMSLLCRAYQHTKNESFLDASIKCVSPFLLTTKNGGVKSLLNGHPWYEEYVDEPIHHVLNGKIYALWGLYDLWKTNQSGQAKDIFDEGVYSIAANMNLFDTGYWSKYWHVDGGNSYIASFMYHNLHICQLKHTGIISDNKILLEYSDRFQDYTDSFWNRMKAGSSLFLSKLSKSFSN